MERSKQTVRVIIISMFILILFILLGVHTIHACLEEERIGLLHLRSYFRSHYHPGHDEDPFDMRWPDYNLGEERYNCCSWYFVQCNHSNDRVIGLNFNGLMMQYSEIYNTTKLWLFNVTLFRPFTQLIDLELIDNGINGLIEYDGSIRISTLKNLRTLWLDGNHLCSNCVSFDALSSLRTLHLSGCGLNDSMTTLGLSNLKQLESLDLSYNNLSSDSIQSLGICELSSLQFLDLSGNYLNNSVSSCLSKLTSLTTLYLSDNSFEDFPFWLTNLTCLEHLYLSGNNFEGQLFLSSLSNLSMLQYLELSRSGLEIQTEDKLWSPTFQLQYLRLADCNLNKPNGIFPTFLLHQYNLSEVDLSDNNLTGSLPPWLFANNSQLRYLWLTNNSFTGSLSFPNVTQPSLTCLDLSRNRFEGKVPDNIHSIFPNLRALYLSSNNFDGHIPPSIAHLENLKWLDVSGNKFSGSLPRELFTHCHFLQKLNISYNHLQGEIIPEYMNLSQLQTLDASSNNFSNTIKDSLLRSPNLQYLDISNNNIMGRLPSWIGNLTRLQVLLTSNNSLNGHISRGICKLYLYYLDLSRNDFIGKLPQCSNFSSLEGLYPNHNNLSGLIPNSMSSWSSLREIDLSENLLWGELPFWIYKLTNLRVLQLGGNNLHCQIPQQICQLLNIEIIDLSRNHLYGWIPACFQNMSFGTREDLPWFVLYPQELAIDSTVSRTVQVVAKRQYYTYAGGERLSMSALDLSCNKLSGVIPPEVGQLRHIKSINLSHNNLIGSIPSSFSNLEQVEGLDLSYNQLTGTIPSQLSELHSLEVFNVSFNNLSGKTPETGQFGTFDEMSYLGNPGLCVSLVNKSCHQTDELIPPTRKQDEEGKALSFLFEDFWWCFGVTSVIAFLTAGAVLAINPYWRRAWFDFVEYHLIWWLF